MGFDGIECWLLFYTYIPSLTRLQITSTSQPSQARNATINHHAGRGAQLRGPGQDGEGLPLGVWQDVDLEAPDEARRRVPEAQAPAGGRGERGGGARVGGNGNVPADGEAYRVVTMAVACKPFLFVLQARGDATLLDVRVFVHAFDRDSRN